jgi:hypothetical protein
MRTPRAHLGPRPSPSLRADTYSRSPWCCGSHRAVRKQCWRQLWKRHSKTLSPSTPLMPAPSQQSPSLYPTQMKTVLLSLSNCCWSALYAGTMNFYSTSPQHLNRPHFIPFVQCLRDALFTASSTHPAPPLPLPPRVVKYYLVVVPDTRLSASDQRHVRVRQSAREIVRKPTAVSVFGPSLIMQVSVCSVPYMNR